MVIIAISQFELSYCDKDCYDSQRILAESIKSLDDLSREIGALTPYSYPFMILFNNTVPEEKYEGYNIFCINNKE